jgi:hypothetical protein
MRGPAIIIKKKSRELLEAEKGEGRRGPIKTPDRLRRHRLGLAIKGAVSRDFPLWFFHQ